MKNIKFTKHSLEKIDMLTSHDFVIDKAIVIKTIENPDFLTFGRSGRKIAHIKLDENHVLRVIYEEIENEITIITMYPGRRNRYEKN